MNTVEAHAGKWRMLTEGSTVWVLFGSHGWRPGIITGLGKNRGDQTVVHLRFETGGMGQRYAGESYWRKPELKAKDKPTTQPVSVLRSAPMKKTTSKPAAKKPAAKKAGSQEVTNHA
jgi:hypothetical protein